MKKITLSLVFLLTMVLSGYGQVSYEYGWEPTTPALGGWTAVSFARNTTTPCVGVASLRANTYGTNTNSITSPSLGISNGGIVTFSFDYKLLNWSANTVATPANQFSIEALWSNSATGPWYPIGTIGEANHEVSTTCTTKIFQFSPTPGTLFVKITNSALNGGDFYCYFDNVVLSQGEAPSCVSPASLVASNVLSNTATVGWAEVSPSPVGYEYYYSDINEAPTMAGTATTGLTADLTGLMSNTNYYFWVRTMCADGQSVWSGPVSFRTLCDPFGDFTEDFNSSTTGTGLVPLCWKKIVTSTSTSSNVSLINHTAASAPNAIYMTNSNDATAQLFLVSPSLTAIGANTHRMKFKARGGVAGQILSVGTMSDPTDASTYVELQSYTLTATYADYNVSLNTTTTANHIAFKHGLGGTYRSVYLDDMVWEAIPTTPPGCIEDMNAVINEGCGNFPTTFTWASVPGADGYKVSIGTSPNGQDLLVDNVNINSALSYSWAGNAGTMYYFTVRPYNAFGDAVDCYEDNFTTYDDGCYCVSVPLSNDNAGISSVQINDVITPVTDVMYADFTENGAIDITQGENTIMNVTLATAYSYFTNVWVDFNDNYTFEPSELVHEGLESSNVNPTIMSTSFMTPTTAGLGQHRMRIISTDNKTVPSNPCYNGSFGITLDFLVNVLEAPDCLPPTASTTSNITASTATATWVSEGTTFNVEYVYANEDQGSGVVTEVTGLTTTFEGLDPEADYAYYLQTVCGEGSESPWTGPFTFRTACDSFGDFIEDFTTEVNYSAPECWYTLINSTVSVPQIIVYNYNDYLQMNNSGNVDAALYLITPSLTDLPLDTHRIKFKARSSSVTGQVLVVGTMSDPTDESTFTAVQTISLTNIYADYSISFLSSTTDMHVAFKHVGTATYQSIYLDDVNWEPAPLCPDITIVNFDGATPYTADLSWPLGGVETAWQYAYGATTVTDPSGLTPVDVPGTLPEVTISGLAPSTSYNVWVRAVCGENFGIWSPAKTILTQCIPVTAFPWTESFEGLTTFSTTSFPPCWSKENGDWSSSNQTTYNVPRTGSNYIRCQYAASNEYMWSPGFELVAGTSYDFSFYMAGDGYDGWTVDVYQNTVQNSVGATQLGVTENAPGVGAMYQIMPYTQVKRTFVPTTSGQYYFAIKVNQPAFPWYISFDDFRMEPTPTCEAPGVPTATDITVTTATMNWVETATAPANGYDYYVSNTTVAPLATTVPTGTVAAGITTASLTDLAGATIYNMYVRSICGVDDTSSWSDAGTFTTNCISASLPYTIDFESTTAPALPMCTTAVNEGTGNNWVSAGPNSYGFTTKVLQYTYNSNAANAWFYTNSVSLVAGTEYSISYDYGNNVDATWSENLKVSYGTSANVASMTNELADHQDIMEGTLQSNVEVFTPTVSGDYVFGFNVYSIPNQYYLYLDNIVIQENLSATDFDTNSFTAYPNPVKDILNLSYTQDISSVAVYNLLGQHVLSMDMNANKGQVDMSSLTTGTYLVKVSTANAVKTIKVIKE